MVLLRSDNEDYGILFVGKPLGRGDGQPKTAP